MELYLLFIGLMIFPSCRKLVRPPTPQFLEIVGRAKQDVLWNVCQRLLDVLRCRQYLMKLLSGMEMRGLGMLVEEKR